jgi:hypothetical protein
VEAIQLIAYIVNENTTFVTNISSIKIVRHVTDFNRLRGRVIEIEFVHQSNPKQDALLSIALVLARSNSNSGKIKNYIVCALLQFATVS